MQRRARLVWTRPRSGRLQLALAALRLRLRRQVNGTVASAGARSAAVDRRRRDHRQGVYQSACGPRTAGDARRASAPADRASSGPNSRRVVSCASRSAFYERTEQPPRRAAVERGCAKVSRRATSTVATSCGEPPRWVWLVRQPPRSARLLRRLKSCATDSSRVHKIPLDVAEWSYMWVNVKRAETARGAFVGGQRDASSMIPTQVRHPFPVVLVHGGGGQGTDWLGTPDGRPGWFQSRCRRLQGLRRRSSRARTIAGLHHGGFPAQALTLESIAGRFTPPAANPANVPNEYQKNHNQWPGPGNVGSDDLGRLTAGMGGSYVVQPAPAAGRGGAPGAPGAGGGRGQGGGRGAAAAGPPPPAISSRLAHSTCSI